ncbi:MAG: pyridoxamine 5'-phosphate oxidase [Planctomycetota bacterium]
MSTPPTPPADLANLRQPYNVPGLHEGDLLGSPFDQFQMWFTQAKAAGIKEPNAMTLATASAEGVPDARIVLLKGLNPKSGFAFYTNYESVKAKQLDANPRATLVFYWDLLDRQVRVQGQVQRLPDATNDGYFAQRPRGSQLGAWTSPQSTVIPNRDVLAQREAELTKQYAGQDVPRPPHWGGYAVLPQRIEFWQGQPSRLHDRLVYVREGDAWNIERLAP